MGIDLKLSKFWIERIFLHPVVISILSLVLICFPPSEVLLFVQSTNTSISFVFLDCILGFKNFHLRYAMYKEKSFMKLIKFVHQWKTWLLLMSEIGSPSAWWPISGIFVHSIKSWRWKTFLQFFWEVHWMKHQKTGGYMIYFSVFFWFLTLAWHYYLNVSCQQESWSYHKQCGW